MTHPLWMILGLILMSAILGRRAVQLHRRRRHLRQLAAFHRLRYSPEDLIDIHQRYQDLELIRQGHSRHARDVIHGFVRGTPLTLFSYSFEKGFGVRSRLERWWMAVLECDGRAMKPRDGEQRVEAALSVGSDRVGRAQDASCSAASEHDVVLEVLERAPAETRCEVRGRLAAIALPDDGSPAAATRVMEMASAAGAKFASRRRERADRADPAAGT